MILFLFFEDCTHHKCHAIKVDFKLNFQNDVCSFDCSASPGLLYDCSWPPPPLSFFCVVVALPPTNSSQAVPSSSLSPYTFIGNCMMDFVSYMCVKVNSVCFIALVDFIATLWINSNILRCTPTTATSRGGNICVWMLCRKIISV